MDTKNIYQKLQEARVELKDQELTKSGKNKYAGYKYFVLGDFIGHINDILLEKKLTSNISYEEDKATLTIINTEKPEEQIVFTTPYERASLSGGTQPIQELGASQTYLRRYLWLTAMEIAEEDPVEAQTGKGDKQENVRKVIKKKIDNAKDLETLEKAKDYINKKIKKNKQELLDLVATKKMKIKSEQEDDGIPVVEDDES